MVCADDDVLPSPLAGLDRLDALVARVQQLEARVSQLEARPASAAAVAEEAWQPPVLPPEATGQSLSTAAVMGLIGRACLIMGGAFLLRASTDSGMLPPVAGVGLALAYCVVWALLADRQARKGAKAWASFQILTAAAIALPMLWETTIRFHYLSPALSAVALLGATVLFVSVAQRHALKRTVWFVLLGSLVTAFGLMAATSAITSFTAYFILVGGATLLVSDSPEWRSLRWPAALGADGAVALMTWLALAPGGSEVLAKDLQGTRVLALALALVGVYLGAILYRTLKRPKAVGGFEVFQAFAVLAAGYGGAIHVASGLGAGAGILGGAALVLGMGCYACAFAFVDRRAEGSRDFTFLTFIALVLILAGVPLIMGGGVMAALCLVLGLAATLQASRFSLGPLQVQATLYLAVAAGASGLLARAWQALVAPGPQGPQGFTFAGLLTLAALLAGHGLALRGRNGTEPTLRLRLATLAVGALGVLALAGLGVALLAPLAKADAGALAVVRTAVLVVLALATALVGRRLPASELPWLAYPLMGLTALKFLLEDFPHGRPATLFLGLTLLGLGLLAVPRCARPAPAREGEVPS